MGCTYRIDQDRVEYRTVLKVACGLCKARILDRWNATYDNKKIFYSAFVGLVSSIIPVLGTSPNTLVPLYYGYITDSAINWVYDMNSLKEFVEFKNGKLPVIPQ